MSWTTPGELKAQVQKLWDRGLLLAEYAGGEPGFPRRLTLKAPTSRDLSERFGAVRDWIARLSAAAGPYRLDWRQINHRVLGANQLPSAVWVDSLDNALGLIGKRRAADAFAALVAQTREQQPDLVPWLAKRPLVALALHEDWPRLLSVIVWVRAHPRPAVYLRQIDLPRVHTKLIERHRGVLTELLDRVLPVEAIDATQTGIGGFCRRYGFLDKPLRIRFRLLDPATGASGLSPVFSQAQTGPVGTTGPTGYVQLCQLDALSSASETSVLAERKVAGASCSRLPQTEAADPDITLTQPAFAALELPVSTVFITENEINFLAFPPVPGAMVIFGAGYGFENIATATWLQSKNVYYWGDIDTHGFAILNQLRASFPHVESLLMDQHTLLDHRPLWGVETRPETATLVRLTADESTLYDQLRQNHWGDHVRLEQERIGFKYLRDALRRL